MTNRKIIQTVAFFIFFLLFSLPAYAIDYPDAGNVAIIEHDGGNYDKDLPDGSVNDAPRKTIASKFYETHDDIYDFFVIFTNFEFDTAKISLTGIYKF